MNPELFALPPRTPRSHAPWRRYLLFALLIAGVCIGGLIAFGKVPGRTFFIVGGTGNGDSGTPQNPEITPIDKDPEYVLPGRDANRRNILVLGMRGKDDPDGGLLTDTIMLFSYDRTTEKAALVSIPRDLYARITNTRSDKINAVYETLGIGDTKKLFGRITGVEIDNIIIFDFTAFQYIVDQVGGVDVTLDRPFTEKRQWGYEFSLPAGPNHLNGEQALYYVRSRYSSSDFDRARRQQQVILALRQKINALRLQDDPIAAFKLLETVRKNIISDLNILDMGSMISLAREIDAAKIRRYQLTTENFLEESHRNGMYILLPRGGSFGELKAFFRSMTASEAPVLPTVVPSATPTS